ncbi:type II toxin-antitoxin system VapC family toxin [Vineibacter terrae]|uniref:Type II toxin-antitoxin system VapC family toxin n=1 Tax=Vineibacter terrae TaxID=2586908 RepID=A0A5C8PPR4_9HYPH|nr:type II toxin-antitoxin system VapC family toxin [Vineibacter terrae]TXL76710.1 type II toxin-antitoxin system VapC family toxin [Vineibacter terrae]
MRLLLDTHSLIWLLDSPEVLRPQAREAIAEPQNDVLVSIASVWEAAIKARTGKLTLPANFVLAIRESGIQILGITEEHALAAAGLPMHHKDPFDRMLIAQAAIEELTLITRDANMPLYGVPILLP